MKFEDLLRVAGEEPVFDTSLLLTGAIEPRSVQRQLSRWTRTGRIIQLRRGLYAFAPLYRKHSPHPFLVANRLVSASYVSLQSALSHHGLIPEYVPVVMSVTTRRPGRWETPLGCYRFRHVRTGLFWGYERQELLVGQTAFVARPEKALLDLLYLDQPRPSRAYLQELRLQRLDRLDLTELERMASRIDTGLLSACAMVRQLADAEASEYEDV